MIRREVSTLAGLSPLPSAQRADGDVLLQQERLLGAIKKPVSDDEARVLIKLFGPDDCYGLAWALLLLIESAPGWPLVDCLTNLDNEWLMVRLRVDSGVPPFPRSQSGVGDGLDACAAGQVPHARSARHRGFGGREHTRCNLTLIVVGDMADV